jgi:hypothetical protein
LLGKKVENGRKKHRGTENRGRRKDYETCKHCKKRLAIFPTRESLVSDIPAGDGKIANLFSQCNIEKRRLKYLLR